jgi:hypothetical protein
LATRKLPNPLPSAQLASLRVWPSINPLTPELNPSAQRCLARIFTGDFATQTVHFLNICVKIQQMQQLSIQLLITRESQIKTLNFY